MITLEEKKESIVLSYSASFDKDGSYLLADLTEEEKELLDKDEDFQLRLKYSLLREKERLISELQSLTKSLDEKIKLSAIEKLGKILYPETFVTDPKLKSKEPVENPNKPPINFILTEEHAAEVLRILAESGVFQSSAPIAVDSKNKPIYFS